MRKSRKVEHGPIELIEEALHLLRRAPFGTIVTYYLGAIPFALGFFYYWADMSQSAFAAERCASSAMVLSLLFVWMKCWQSVFAQQLLGVVRGYSGEPWTLKRAAQLILTQAALQPSALFVLPISLVLAFPFGWTWAFYQNVTVLGDRETASESFKDSARLSNLQQGQNHLLILMLMLFGMVCFMNLFAISAQLPYLAKTFLGIESVFTRSGGGWILNTTLLAVVVGMTWLCIDPLIKAVYVLRCFYIQSLDSGEDLATELRFLSRSTPSRSLVSLIVFFLCAAPMFAQDSAKPAQSQTVTVSSSELDRSISSVLEKREFSWRLPREKAAPKTEKRGWFQTMVETVVNWFRDWARDIRDLIRNVFEWIRKLFPQKDHNSGNGSGSGEGWITSLRVIFFLVVAIIIAILLVMLMRVLKNRRKEEVVVAQKVATIPDLADENVIASQLPEDEWLKLARELAGQGNLRVALRAYYLASLAHLAHRELIAVAKFKSNRDYERELRRRARSRPELQEAFSDNVSMFDRSWYGLREVTLEILTQFQQNLERIRAC